MQIKMDYGRTGLMIDAPDNADVFTNNPVPGVDDETTAILKALDHPFGCRSLTHYIKPGIKVVIVHTDITRATPNDRLLPVILAYLEEHGVSPTNITLLNALGTHRAQTLQELKQMLGENVVNKYRCLQHDAFDNSQLVSVGESTFHHPITINRVLLEADLKILTGFIEPHFFAGFSGGPKAILPGVAGAEAIFANHSPGMISNPNADFNVLEGNPVWDEMKEAAVKVENCFLVNVTLNQDREITGVFAGDVIDAHREGCQFLRKSSIFPISRPYDLVVTSNSGYPLDQNLYQCVKGLAAAKRGVRKGGSILLIADCSEGLPDKSTYAKILKGGSSPEAIFEIVSQPSHHQQDAWQVQIQAKVQMQADCYVYSDSLSDDQIKLSMLKPCRDIPSMINNLVQKFGHHVCVLPQGPLTILELKGET